MSAEGGTTAGVFGTDPESKEELERSVAKKSEAEGVVVYHSSWRGMRVSIIDLNVKPLRVAGGGACIL